MKFVWTHILWFLGFAQAVLAVLATATDIFTPLQLKIILLCNAVVTSSIAYFKANPLTDGVTPVVKSLILATLFLPFLSGCGTLGLTQPANAQQTVAYGYGGVTGALNTLAQIASQGLISSVDAQKANQAILTAKAGIDQANTVVSSDAPTAISLVTTATKELAVISTYLTCKQEKQTTCQLSP